MLHLRLAGASLSLLLLACSGGGAGAPDASGSAGSGTAGGRAGTPGGGAGGTAGAAGSGGVAGGGGKGGTSGTVGGPGTAGRDGGAPDGGPRDGSTVDAAGSASFSSVQAIFAASCVRCHDPAHPFVPETQTYVALSLTMKDAYAALVNKAASEPCGGTLVRPGDPSKSYLYAKVTQDAPCDGQRMPHQGMIRTPPLPADQIAVIESWIRGGAKP